MAEKKLIGIGIIGAGFARTTQIPGFLNCENTRVVAIASRTRQSAERVAGEFNIPIVADDWRKVVEHPDIDLISIVTPPVTHAEMTFAALDAGKSVLCEKPMAMNAEEAKRMRRRAEERGAFAHIDHELRFLEGRRRMRALIRNGEIGRVRHAKYLWRADSRSSPSLNWNWWSDEKQGGGALGAIGSHAVDSFRWLLGAEVEQVFCSLQTHVRERAEAETGETRKVTTDDEVNMLIRFIDNELMKEATGAISLSVVEPGEAAHRAEVFGERGALAVGEMGDLWSADVGAGKWTLVQEGSGEVAAGIPKDSGWGRGFTEFAQRIVEALREGRGSVEGAATFEDGYRTQLVLDAARRSHEKGCWAKIETSRGNE
ncbi:MAG: Gfo/Idh/MocA family oxidoreductase [Pyrinomonadaceae bacterium]|nr:Gfo/Idh/MocA family oxidoreductase [Pyrinomonadaceae bacterium]